VTNFDGLRFVSFAYANIRPLWKLLFRLSPTELIFIASSQIVVYFVRSDVKPGAFSPRTHVYKIYRPRLSCVNLSL
jgi:hypothetical protein